MNRRIVQLVAVLLTVFLTFAGVTVINLTTQVSGTLPTGNGGTGVTDQTYSGNTHKAATASGTLTSGNLVKFDASGNVVDDGIAVASVSGNTTKAVTTTGSLTSGNCAKWDANGNAVDSGGVCGGSGTAAILVETFQSTQASGNTAFWPMSGGGASESSQSQKSQFAAPRAGTVGNLNCVTYSTQAAGGALTFTSRKNGTDQTLLVSFAAGAVAGLATDSTHTFTVVAGDLLSYKIANAGSGTSAAFGSCSVTIS